MKIESLSVFVNLCNRELWVCLGPLITLIRRECVFHYCEMNQTKESKAQEALLLSQAGGTGAGEVICLLFYFLHVTARKNGLKPTQALNKKSRPKLDSLEQKEV